MATIRGEQIEVSEDDGLKAIQLIILQILANFTCELSDIGIMSRLS